MRVPLLHDEDGMKAPGAGHPAHLAGHIFHALSSFNSFLRACLTVRRKLQAASLGQAVEGALENAMGGLA